MRPSRRHTRSQVSARGALCGWLRYVPAMKKIAAAFVVLLALVVGVGTYVYLDRPSPEELGLQRVGGESGESGDLTVRWLGVSTLLIDDGTTQLMTDGFISRPGLRDLILDRPVAPDEQAISSALESFAVDRLAALMTVHSHYDHAMDTGVVAVATGADVLGSASTANVARGAGVPEDRIVEVSFGQPYRYGAFEIRFFEGRHAPLVEGGPPMPGTIGRPLIPPQPVSAWREGGSNVISISHPEGDMLIVGSAGYLEGALDGLDVDMVFLGIGGLSTLPQAHVLAYVRESVHLPKAERVYIIHHEDLTASFGDIRMMPTLVMDRSFLDDLQQELLPAETYYLPFGEAVRVSDQ